MQPNREKVILTGFMGTGKTTVGRLIATLLEYEFVDTDELIEMRHGPITEIFKRSGQDRFRELESAIAVELADATGTVIATGGRMMLDPENAANLAAGAHVFCLVARPEDIAERVAGSDRPLLDHEDPAARIEQLLDERHAGYSEFRAVDTSGREPVEIAADIVRQVQQAHNNRTPVDTSRTAPSMPRGLRAMLAPWRRYRARGRR